MTANLPSLPKIEGDSVDLVLDVYTHHSLRPGPPQLLNQEYGDTHRLAELGAKLLELAVTFHYYSKRPMLSASELTVGFYEYRGCPNTQRFTSQDKCSSTLSDSNIAFWLDSYGLRRKLRYAPSEKENINTPQVRRHPDQQPSSY